MSFIFRRVVSVCCVKDIKVWKLTAHYLPKYIDSIEYLLVVPDNEVSLFRGITPSIWSVRGEGEFVYDYSKNTIENRLVGKNVGRAGWYLQQFIKINAILDPILSDDDYVLIWDADTVPLKKIKFMGSSISSRLMFYSGSEFHHPYFLTLNKMLGIERVGNFSFIAQCLPTKVAWVREMLSTFPDYVDFVLSALPGKSVAEFSEYETIGTFIFLNYPQCVALNKRRWSRWLGGHIGLSQFAIINRVLLTICSIFYDHMTFECQVAIWKKPLNKVTFIALINAINKKKIF